MLNLAILKRKKVRFKNRFKEFRYRNLLNFMRTLKNNNTWLTPIIHTNKKINFMSQYYLIYDNLKNNSKPVYNEFLGITQNDGSNILKFFITNKRQPFLFLDYKDLRISLSSGSVLKYMGVTKKSLKYSKNNFFIILNLIKRNKNLFLNIENLKLVVCLKYWNINLKTILNTFLNWQYKSLRQELKIFILQNNITFSKNKFKKIKSLKKRLKKKIIKIS